MAKQPESRLQLKIRKHLEKTFKGSWWFKVHGGPFQPAGIPDLLGCVDGQFFAFEVKRPGKRPSAIQRKVMGIIQEAGGVAEVVYTPTQAEEYVRAALSLSA